MLFEPPNVSGWDDARWLDTATFRARWQMAARDLQPGAARRRTMRGKVPAEPAGAGPPRRRVLGRHAAVARATRARARALRRRRDGDRRPSAWKRESYPVLTENALRMLVAVSPDYLTS